MDDRTVASLGERTLREAYADLIRQVDAASPRAIAVDVRFDKPGATGTGPLVAAIRAARAPIVLAFAGFEVVAPEGAPPRVQVALLDTTLRTADCHAPGVDAWLGYAGLPTDPDHRERRLEAAAPVSDDQRLCAFPVVVAERLGRVDEGDLRTARRRAWQFQTGETAWIDFRGPPGTFAPMSAGALRPAALRDKVVVIGSTAAGQDLQRTPYDEPMAGAEVHANAIATILDGVPLRDGPGAVDVLAIVALALVAPLAALRLRSRRRVIVAVVGAGVAFVAAAWIAFLGGWVIALVAPLTALALGAAATALIDVARRRGILRG
jgi:CHASE2 domain-containing sensor protein